MRALRMRPRASYVRPGIARVSEHFADAHGANYAKTVSSREKKPKNLLTGMNSKPQPVGICMETKSKKPSKKMIAVSERTVQTAAIRLLPKQNKLVSAEVDYVRRTLGEKATQIEIDEKVTLVRQLPWNEIVAGQ